MFDPEQRCAASVFATIHRKIHWHWVKGHAGHTDNERCDELANEAIAAVKASHTPAQLKMLLEEFKAEAEAQLL